MSERDDAVYLRHILAAISRIEEYLEGADKTVFSQNHLLQDGIIRQLQIIGEATSRVTPPLRQRYPQVPWSDIVGMRHKIIHDYFGVDLDVVWTAATEELPQLKAEALRILEDLPPTILVASLPLVGEGQASACELRRGLVQITATRFDLQRLAKGDC